MHAVQQKDKTMKKKERNTQEVFWRRLSAYYKALVVKMEGQTLGDSADLHLQNREDRLGVDWMR